MTNWIDMIFSIWNSSYGIQIYGIGIVTCILALFCRLRGRKNVY